MGGVAIDVFQSCHPCKNTHQLCLSKGNMCRVTIHQCRAFHISTNNSPFLATQIVNTCTLLSLATEPSDPAYAELSMRAKLNRKNYQEGHLMLPQFP